MSTGTSGRIKKNNSKYEILNHLYFDPNFVFWGDCFRVFQSMFFLIFRHRPTMVADIFTQPLPATHYNEASYAPANKAKRFAEYCNILFFRISTYLTHRYRLIFGNKGFVKSYETNELFRKKASQTVFFMKRRSLVLY